MRVRPVSFATLVAELSERVAGLPPDRRARVALDGAPAARPDALADALIDPLRVRGRPALHVRTADYVRPASLRFEFGRTDPDNYYTGWFDEAGLRREALDPLEPDGTGKVLPALWNPRTDRSARAAYIDLPPGGVLLVSGPFLLGGGLPFELTVHLEMTPPALARRTDPDEAWTLPAYARYADEVTPALFADVVIRIDDPRHPAIVDPD